MNVRTPPITGVGRERRGEDVGPTRDSPVRDNLRGVNRMISFETTPEKGNVGETNPDETNSVRNGGSFDPIVRGDMPVKPRPARTKTISKRMQNLRNEDTVVGACAWSGYCYLLTRAQAREMESFMEWNGQRITVFDEG